MSQTESKKLEELLQSVTDRDSFLAFLSALIADRKAAEERERSNPDRYRWGAAVPGDWEHSSISSYLGAAACYFKHPIYSHRDTPSHSAPLSWRDFAEFLYLGKIYE
jgi:hypothetical protein